VPHRPDAHPAVLLGSKGFLSVARWRDDQRPQVEQLAPGATAYQTLWFLEASASDPCNTAIALLSLHTISRCGYCCRHLSAIKQVTQMLTNSKCQP
jgi:hypothetical protein